MATLQIESLLAKFGCKGQSYGNATPGRPLFSVEEQLAMVGICWNRSPAGWQCLMFECLNDHGSYRELLTTMICEANLIMRKWRGPLHGSVLLALSVTAIAESTQKEGIICGECKGSAKAMSKGKLRKCPACNEGRVKWTDQTRFASFSQSVCVPYERFIRYAQFLKGLVEWLSREREVAISSINNQLQKENIEAQKAA